MATISINSSEVFTVTRVNDGKSYGSCRIEYRWGNSTTWNTFTTLSSGTSSVTSYTYTPTEAQKKFSPAYYRAIFINVGRIVNNHDISAEMLYTFPKNLSPAPYRAPIDCSAYIGRSTDNVPILHTAQQGTALSVLKSSTNTASSYFHSNQLPVCATSMYEFAGTRVLLDESLARYLDTVVFLCMAHEISRDTWYAMNMRWSDGTTSTRNNMSFEGLNNTYFSDDWVVGHTRYIKVGLPQGPGYAFDKIRIYPLNISLVGRYISYKDFSVPSHPEGVMISKTGMYVNKLRLDSLMPLASVSSNMFLPNYVDQIYPTGGTSLAQDNYIPVYNGTAENCLQILGSTTFGAAPTWEIAPNKGTIKKNGITWWDAAFGRTRVWLNPYYAKQTIRTLNASYPWSYPVALGSNYTTTTVNDNYAVLPSQLNYTTETTYGVCKFLRTILPGMSNEVDTNLVHIFTKGMPVYLGSELHEEKKTEKWYAGMNTSPYIRDLWRIRVLVHFQLYVASDNSLRVRSTTIYSTYRYTKRSDGYPTTISPPLKNMEFSVFQIY